MIFIKVNWRIKVYIDSHLYGNDIKENENGKEDIDSRPPIMSRTGFSGMTRKEEGMTKNFYSLY